MEHQIATTTAAQPVSRPPILARSIKLMKPVTWFPPTWAFLCGAVASGATGLNLPDVARIMLGMLMAGPILCGLSQVINDYFDREIDAINEPHRLIPSGMVSLWQVAVTVVVLVVVGMGIALYLGRAVFFFSGLGLILAILYSAPPFRAKRNGWVGNTLVAISYEGLAWMAGHAAFAILTPQSMLIAVLYSVGTHGIMSINDYKGINGDRASNIMTLPVQYGPRRTAWIIVATMDLAQIGIIAAFLAWGNVWAALILTVIVLIQLPLQYKFLQDPMERYLTFSAFGVSIFVWGMLAAALALRAV